MLLFVNFFKIPTKRGWQKLLVLISVLFITAFPAFADSVIEDVRFSLTPKIMKDGYITDLGIGVSYTDDLWAEIKIRYTHISKNEELFDAADSLNAVKENIFELFFLPAGYNFVKTAKTRVWAGGGFYYEYDTLQEKGFFNMPELESLTPPKERVNFYENEFSMHLFGPLADAGISYNANWFDLSFSAGIVPVFYLRATQELSIDPLLEPSRADFSQNTWGSPYLYASLGGVFFEYFHLLLLYGYARLKYKAIDFDANLNWITPEKTVSTRSLKIEASILVPLSGGTRLQFGGGYTFDSVKMDSESAITGNRKYFILTVRKTI